MTEPSVPPIAHADTIAGLAKGLAVLESFDTERQRLNATMAAQRAGLTRAAGRRHLLTLAHLGYLETDGAYYWLAPKVLGFSGAYMASARLPRVVQPELHSLAARTGLSFSCAVRDGDFVVIVARSAVRERGDRLLAHGVHLGSRLPVHATSTGRVLLAALPDAERAAWLARVELRRLTAHTVSDAAALAATLDQVRQQDYCCAAQEHELGIQALAVPLRDARGRVLAALNVVTATNRMDPRQLVAQLLAPLQEAARVLRPLL
mgnify:FL=1